MKYLFIGTICIFIIISLGFLFKKQTPNPVSNQTAQQTVILSPTLIQPPKDRFASFAIYTNGIFRVFTAAMYHNRSSDVYITAQNPNILTIKKEETTWNDFFSTLPFSLSPTCLVTGTKETFCTGSKGTLSFYLNNKPVQQVLDEEIHHGDQLLVTFGNPTSSEISNQLQSIPQTPSN